MEGQVKVLLVTTEEPPTELKQELGRLGVDVEECAFADAEECILEGAPDLVALAGARGAVELSTILEDSEDGPHMVIVAERKELAKLRGLNRDIVVSLFALETTEKVVGQRIESLARRAARKKGKPEPQPVPSLKKTALGIPLAAPRSGELPTDGGSAEQAAAQVASPPPPAATDALSRGDEPEPKPAPAAPVAKVELKKAPLGARGIVEEPGDSRSHPAREVSPSPPRTTKADASPPAPPVAAPRAAAPRPVEKAPGTAQAPAVEEGISMLQVLDEELLESIMPTAAPNDGGVNVDPIPMNSALPEIEDAPVAEPLPAQAKTNSALMDLRLSASPGELDISSAESALDNLDSVKLALTEELVRQAQRDMAQPGTRATAPEEVDAFSILPDSIPPEDDGAHATPTKEGNKADALGATVAMTSHASALDFVEAAASRARAEAEDARNENASAAHFDPASLLDDASGSDEAREDESPGTAASNGTKESSSSAEGSLETGIPVDSAGGPAPRKKSGGVGLVFISAALVAGGGLVLMNAGGGLEGGAASSEPAASAERPAAQEAPSPAKKEAASGAAPSASPEPSTEKDATAVEGTPAVEGAPSAENPDVAPPGPSAPAAGTLENPFLLPEEPTPTCDTLLQGAAPDAMGDALATSSAAWSEARKAIVSADLKLAHRKMCEAVTLNPESAAVEGLAHLYLRLRAPTLALTWADKAYAFRPGQIEIGNLRGDALAFLGRVDEARAVWLKTLNIQAPDDPRVGAVSKDYSVEAGRDLRRGDFARAELFFRRAVILDGQNLTGLIGLSKVYQKLEKPEYARAFAEMSLRVSDVMPEVHVLLGELAMAAGNKAEAILRFERAIAVRPDYFPAKRGLAEAKK